MPFAYISQLDVDLWRLSFYEFDRGHLRRASSVTCCWASALIILEIRERNEQGGSPGETGRTRRRENNSSGDAASTCPPAQRTTREPSEPRATLLSGQRSAVHCCGNFVGSANQRGS